MSKNGLAKIILGHSSWAFIRFLVTIAAVGMIGGGFYLILCKIAGGGTIDVKTVFLEGKLESGSVGLLFSFLGVILLGGCTLPTLTSKLTITRGKNGVLTVKHKGAFGEKKAKAIAAILEADANENKAPES